MIGFRNGINQNHHEHDGYKFYMVFDITQQIGVCRLKFGCVGLQQPQARDALLLKTEPVLPKLTPDPKPIVQKSLHGFVPLERPHNTPLMPPHNRSILNIDCPHPSAQIMVHEWLAENQASQLPIRLIGKLLPFFSI